MSNTYCSFEIPSNSSETQRLVNYFTKNQNKPVKRRYDIQHNDIQHNDNQHNDTQHIDTQHNDTQHVGFVYDTQQNWYRIHNTTFSL